ncbi:Fc receptor 5 [Labeo rohita]|uniref:Fc receptor 5 n=1 Tax=Labeo rohita TaxID=84645 RepID=A0A498N3I6_LABRO|nr:Fc receptor 5 [Labeo rohita]
MLKFVTKEDEVVPSSTGPEGLSSCTVTDAGCSTEASPSTSYEGTDAVVTTAHNLPTTGDNLQSGSSSIIIEKPSLIKEVETDVVSPPVSLPPDPWQKLGIDIVGPFDSGPSDCRFAISLIDYHMLITNIYSGHTEVLITNIYSGHTEASSRRSGSDDLSPVIVGVSAGLTVTFLIVVFFLLWRYRNKGGRSQSPSSVSQQQNSSQTSEQNQSETGNKTLMSGAAHIYDSVDATINKDISTDIVSGATELTYADIELKSTEKQKKMKENKGKTSESSDTVYSKLTLVTHQGECQNKNFNHNSQGAAENYIYKHC